MKRKLVILSHDAMVKEDVEREKNSPAFSYLLREGAWIETTRTIWPSITYPAHTSIISGQYPDKTGICHNDHFTPDTPEPGWNWDAKYQHSYSLFEAAKKKGLTTACSFWPVSGNHPCIDYLIPEYWPQNETETPAEALMRMGTSEKVIRDIVLPNYPDNKNFLRIHPLADQFVIDCAADMIRKYKPDILAIHPAAVDDARHKNGVFNEKVYEAVRRSAVWTQEIIDAMRDAGTLEDTVFAVMSDHGQVDIDHVMSPNAFFVRKGLLEQKEDGSFGNWVCYLRSTGVTAEIYVNGAPGTPGEKRMSRAEYEENLRKTREALEEMAEIPRFEIDRILTREEIQKEEHLSGPFTFFLIGKGKVAYSNLLTGGIEMEFDAKNFQTGYATHGMDPDLGPQPTCLICGPGIRKGTRVPRRPIVDIAPTLAELLGLELPDADGQVIREILF